MDVNDVHVLYHVSAEKKTGSLRYLDHCTTQLCEDYSKPLNGSLLSNQDSMESKAGLLDRGSYQMAQGFIL